MTRRPSHLVFSCCGNAVDDRDFADEFVAGDAVEVVVAAENFHIGVADAGEADSDERPVRAQTRQWFFYGDELVISDGEREHEICLRSASAKRGGQSGGQLRLLFREDRAEIEDDAIVFDARDDGNAAGGSAQALLRVWRQGSAGW